MICSAGHVRSAPESGRPSHAQSCLLWATSGLMRRSKLSNFDHFVSIASRLSGTVKPSSLATLRLIANSSLIGAWIGRSNGLSLRQIQSLCDNRPRGCCGTGIGVWNELKGSGSARGPGQLRCKAARDGKDEFLFACQLLHGGCDRTRAPSGGPRDVRGWVAEGGATGVKRAVLRPIM